MLILLSRWRYSGTGKQFFKYAIGWKLINDTPVIFGLDSFLTIVIKLSCLISVSLFKESIVDNLICSLKLEFREYFLSEKRIDIVVVSSTNSIGMAFYSFWSKINYDYSNV